MKVPLLAIVLVLCTFGCNPQDAANMQRDTSRIAHDTTAAATNAQLVARVGAVFSQLKEIDMSGIHLEAKSGTLILGGHVQTAHQKQFMQQVALEVRGVQRVQNDLRVVSQGN